MVDIVDPSTRSRMMKGIRGRDTEPERIVRRYLHAAGLRFRLGGAGLPGRPDIVLPRHRVALFVHGCFWHRHEGCRFATTPATNAEFWKAKFVRNVARDLANEEKLKMIGWVPLVIWECQTVDAEALDGLVWQVLASGADRK
ncbi:MAG: DNA mismatch endonuclease Vsr [Rhodoferax sp.]|nr:DNA mismatch endonuclease Vsr [Rhodoferax sp.]